jgi:hypothetical protein
MKDSMPSFLSIPDSKYFWLTKGTALNSISIGVHRMGEFGKSPFCTE